MDEHDKIQLDLLMVELTNDLRSVVFDIERLKKIIENVK